MSDIQHKPKFKASPAGRAIQAGAPANYTDMDQAANVERAPFANSTEREAAMARTVKLREREKQRRKTRLGKYCSWDI